MSAKVLIACSTNFNRKKLFSDKIGAILSSLDEYSVMAINDANGLISDLFSERVIRSIDNKLHLREKRKILEEADYIVLFWDGSDINEYVYLAQLLDIKSRLITVETTKVANKDRGQDFDIYIGRGTPWGNPFVIGDDGMTREDVIEKYKVYFEEKFINNSSNLKALRSLMGMRLGCHCKPALCHGDIIAQYLNKIES